MKLKDRVQKVRAKYPRKSDKQLAKGEDVGSGNFYEQYGDIYNYGMYRLGLTSSEIKEYLKKRTGARTKREVETLYKIFCEVAGVNTMALMTCEHCKKQFTLMYRSDVARFADLMLLGISTFWD